MKALTSIRICRLFCDVSKMRAQDTIKMAQNRRKRSNARQDLPSKALSTRGKNKAAVSLDFARAMCYTQSCMNGIFVCSG